MSKIDAIKAVLEKRADVLREVLKRTNLSPIERAHYQGKKVGYEQAIDLLGESLESITIEL